MKGIPFGIQLRALLTPVIRAYKLLSIKLKLNSSAPFEIVTLPENYDVSHTSFFQARGEMKNETIEGKNKYLKLGHLLMT